MEASPTGKGQHIGVVLFWLTKYLKSINCKNKLKNILLNVEKTIHRMVFYFYIKNSKVQNDLPFINPVFICVFYINQISQNKSQKLHFDILTF